MKHQLYQWQEDCLRRWFSNNGRGMVQAVTGSGKTLLALTAAERLAQAIPLELRVKIVVPTAVLMRQWERALKDHYPENVPGTVGLKGGGHKSPPDRPYMIYVINSARYELARQILAELRDGCAVLLIADECHRYASGQNQLIFEFLPHMGPYAEHFFSLGLSATLPGGQIGQELAAALGRRIYSYEMPSALAQHTVCPYDIFHIGLCFQKDEQADYDELTDRMAALYARLLQVCPELGRLGQRDRFELLRSLSDSKNGKAADAANQYMRLTYRRKSLVCMASARLNCALDLIRHLGIQNKILVFSERIKQAETLYERLSEQYPGKVGRCHSKLGALANKNVIERFRSGDIRILIACKAIDEGADIPDATIGIILSATSTQRQRIQRLGRIIRKNKGKSKALLYYLHIADSSENPCFLPDAGEAPVTELEYRPDSHTFFNPPYAQRAFQFLEQIKSVGLSQEKMQEIMRCLALGSVRADWTLPEEILTEQIRNAVSARERNYWICMRKLGV